MNKTAILSFEGLDGSGKTTLSKALQLATKYKYMHIDRFTGSKYVYDKLYNRPFKQDSKKSYLFGVEQAISSVVPMIVVHCFAPIKTCTERVLCKDNKDSEEANKVEANLIEQKILFNEYFVHTPLPVIDIDTTNSIEQCSTRLKKGVEQYVQRWYEK